jgi:starch synthase
MRPLNVLSVASEIFPLIKTGGLADVAGALPAALAGEGVSVRTLVPGYPAVMRAANPGDVVHHYAGLFGGPARLLSARAGPLDLFIVDAPHLFERPGSPYSAPEGWDWPDNARRFAALGRVAADIGQGLAPGFVAGHRPRP